MIRKLLLATLVAAVPAGAVAAPAQGAALLRPARVAAVSAKPGPGAGQVTFTWRQDGSNTTAFVVETGLTSFKANDPNLPDHGRGAKYFTISPKRRSVTLSAAQVAAAGARAGSANHLYYRLRAVNKTRAGTVVRDWPYLQSVGVRPAAASTAGTALRVASFNVRTANAVSDGRTWLRRAPLVAKTIVSRNPGVVAVQELNPHRADGQKLPVGTSLRQTVSLLRALAANGAGKYRLVRTSPYGKPGVLEGTQGARILYDSSRYSVVSRCPETSADGYYSPSCTILLPIRAGDSGKERRRAAYAVLQDRASGKRFYVVSAHLDARHSKNLTTEASLEALRGNQVKTALARVDQLNTAHLPVVLAGDLNSWQNNKGGYRAHDTLVTAGFYDTAAAATQVNIRYTTMTDFARTVPSTTWGWGARLDVIAVKGIRGAQRFENVMKVTDSNRASDHNMIVADVRLP
jgi:endonuclease/exonuclease/phosphatase family metal-dependent hydrolase